MLCLVSKIFARGCKERLERPVGSGRLGGLWCGVNGEKHFEMILHDTDFDAGGLFLMCLISRVIRELMSAIHCSKSLLPQAHLC